MKSITELDGYEFAQVMDKLKECKPKLYKKIFDYYFSESGSVEESWEDDCDEVWDAEGYLSDLMEEYPEEYKELIESVLVKF